MSQYFETKVSFRKTIEDGTEAKVNETYLVDAETFTEAEARITEEMSPYMNMTSDFTVANIKRANYGEYFFTDETAAEKFFKVKMSFITLDEKSGKEKRTSSNVLVQASDLRDSIRRTDEGMKGSMLDYDIASVVCTPIVDVFPFKGEKEQA